MRPRAQTLWLASTIGLALSVLGATVLFTPTLEFRAVDLIEKLHLPIGPIGIFALYTELALFTLSTLGLIALTIHHLTHRRKS